MPEPYNVVDDQFLSQLRTIVGDESVVTSDSVREQHGKDESYHPHIPPDVVVYPHSTEDVSQIVKACSNGNIPVIPYGTGTSLEGHISALFGGVCIDMIQMDDVVEVNAEDMDVTVQAGVTRKALNSYLRDTGLFFPVDPGADASLGGMAATRASGTNAVRYGTMRETVLSLTVVLADGRVIRTARRARKSVSGYDLTRLMVGSEGTLGVITEVTLRLSGIPEAISSAVVSFDDVRGAVDSVIATIQTGVPIARIEFLDEVSVDAVNRRSGLEYATRPTLFLEFHGTDAGVKEQAEMVEEIAAGFGGSDFQWTADPEQRSKLWTARHEAYYSVIALRPGSRALTTDVCVPISRLADCILETRQDFESTDLIAPMLGHVGDGNFHIAILVDPENEDEIKEAMELNNRLVKRALDMDGTCSGEHGVGYGKMDFLNEEHGDGVDVMRAIKVALDPGNILNPGKIVRV